MPDTAAGTATGTAAPAVSRVDVTGAAADMLRHLAATHGQLMFHQSGGCCDGSSPMCYPVGMFRVGASDVHLGTLHVEGIYPVDVYMSRSQFEYWKYTHLTIDLVDGRGSGFSIEAPEGKRFMIRSRMLDDRELEAFGLATHGSVSP
ncbi:DUF779 domain-containing protein [Herbiconiux moechotypicola]|uniref:DUF779 domain-containing protein n=1 Tax=Herbiconiux moechotypicola TaxID=637393 RepID=A0ABN3E3L9_9MICO|nr:DUF779 domain-containing protein [Herbiconiux moechotypicola]MCS5731564.1 DUF779 domain-containing protein [Herbiconiux moechotypicola]